MASHDVDDPTAIEFDDELVERYNRPGPRYASYPTADRFVEAFDADRYGEWVGQLKLSGKRGMSLYVHLPFCQTTCHYCACHQISTQHSADADRYLDYLEREISLQRALFSQAPQVCQLQLGGGSPAFLHAGQLTRLMNALDSAFPRQPSAECSVAIDPRQLAPQLLERFAGHGFDRISVGVPDLDPAVQAAVNRIQPTEMTSELLAQARRLGFKSISIDLLYGLPHQTVSGMAATVAQVLQWRPDRVALGSYVHRPDRFKPQRHIDAATLPPPAAKLAMLKSATHALLAQGYVYIGMDHFALPHDDLTLALRQGRLHRNFQGYSTHADCDLLALGVSAISKLGNAYAQNHRQLDDYYDALDQHRLPVARGVVLSGDDLLRRAVIQALLCHAELVIEPFETSWLINFRQHFASEIAALEPLVADGLVLLDDRAIQITPKGRPLARAIAMAFDRYLRDAKASRGHAQLI
jgi:oxygen-independent coproporphyrinogen-3 oxidase